MIEGQEGVTWPEWVALAQACEAHGIPALFRSDHHLDLSEVGGARLARRLGDDHRARRAHDARCGSARSSRRSPSATRRRSRSSRSPPTTCRGGRVELGLGAGWHEREHAAYGFPFPPLRERMDMLEEQLEIVHGHWADGPFSFAGEHYRLEALDAQPKPVQQPHPPLIMGGQAGPRGAALAARWADEYNTAVRDARGRGGDEGAASTRRARRPGASRSRSRS